MGASYVVALRLVRAVNCHTSGEDYHCQRPKTLVKLLLEMNLLLSSVQFPYLATLSTKE